MTSNPEWWFVVWARLIQPETIYILVSAVIGFAVFIAFVAFGED